MATGALVNGKVELTAEGVDFPLYVRYACQPYLTPMASLYNNAGLPAYPFKADVASDAVYVKLSSNSVHLYIGTSR